ncbi:hypothetical protein DB35_15875 [Streptomyces abyssalis]|uniref:Uncharacterized protein n=1 Tax=Streptomyces abyssalis TaxID=933944 RepID=A0A1E7JFS1_9ACTN|nr:hypothetical protein [Streptomyces abyssalis]OEU85300.1 hypothetical protein AN215_22145 [Streptomyces abyssalis]OEU91532.1 hypothetical protein DB35_15875 [Streptomyces abyssalis]OEV06063.1 hypothetical protein AN219_35700 [Streptomyces nanshensis]
MNWEVHAELVVEEDGLDPVSLSERLSAWFAAHGADALPELTMADGGTAETVGAVFGVPAETPGQAVDAALHQLRSAADGCGVPVGPVDEVLVRRAHIDPRAPVAERRR